jgi:hypothetical protein
MTEGRPRAFSDLEVAAIAFNQARRHALALRDARNPIDCERENHQGLADYRQGAQEVPCWKLWKEDRTNEGFDRDSIETWCPSCQRRQALTDELRKANASRGARLRHFQKLAGQAVQP